MDSNNLQSSRNDAEKAWQKLRQQIYKEVINEFDEGSVDLVWLNNLIPGVIHGASRNKWIARRVGTRQSISFPEKKYGDMAKAMAVLAKHKLNKEELPAQTSTMLDVIPRPVIQGRRATKATRKALRPQGAMQNTQ